MSELSKIQGVEIARKRKALKLSQEDLGEILGVSSKTISRWESDSVEIPRTKVTQIIDFLVSDIVPKKAKNGKSDKSDKSDIIPQEDMRYRIPTAVAAGSLMGFADAVKAGDCELQPVIKNFPAYDFTIIVKGDSMEPKFEGGDEVAIKKVTSFVEWGKTYVLDTRDGAVIKRLYDAGDCFRCVSFNKEYPDFEVRKSDVFDVYRVVGLLRM